MPIESFLEKQKKPINSALNKTFPKKLSKKWLEFVLGKSDYDFDLNALNESVAFPIHEFLERGGKRWRPALMLLCCEVVGGNSKKILQFAALPEMVHSGTIIIDDIQDDSKLRRGKSCLHLLHGIDVASNDSNLLYFLPLQLLYKNPLKLNEKTLLKIYNLYAEEMIRVSIGQGTDIYWHKKQNFNITESQYLQMCVSKTGVLARMAAKLGAILGNASQKQIDSLGKFGESIGIAFQIQDDILNLTSKEFQKEKGIGEDIHEGKITLLVIKTLEKASAEDKKILIKILKSHPSDKKSISKAISIIEKYGAIDYARNKAEKIVLNAWKKVEIEIPKSEAKKTLKDFAEFLVKRKI